MREMNGSFSGSWRMEPKWTMEDGLILRGLTALFRAVGDGQYRNIILNYMKDGVSDSGNTLIGTHSEAPHDAASCGNALIFAWNEAGDARYQKSLPILVSRIEADSPPDTPLKLYGTAPFMAEYDTQFGGKQTYKVLVRHFVKAHEALFDGAKGLYCSSISSLNDRDCSLRDEGLMLMALVDTMEKIEMQIYEHYRALADLFLIAAKGLFPWQDKDTGLLHRVIDQTDTDIDWGGNAMVIYALRKGVRMGLLDEEKYLPWAKRAYSHLEAYIQASPELFDEWTCGPVMMAQAEMREV